MIARQDPVVEIQREAVETLGDLSDARGVPLLLDLARTHPDTGVRREAIETLGDTDPTENLVRLLKGFALEDADAAVQVERSRRWPICLMRQASPRYSNSSSRTRGQPPVARRSKRSASWLLMMARIWR